METAVKCEACERGDHDNCGMQTWCDCDCEGYQEYIPPGYFVQSDLDGDRLVKKPDQDGQGVTTMDATDIKDKVRAAIEAHIKDKGMVTGPDRLVDRICAALGAVDEWKYDGWTIRRRTGAELKVRGMARGHFGWEGVHAETGYTETWEPSPGSGDVPADTVKRSIDLLNKLRAKTGSFR